MPKITILVPMDLHKRMLMQQDRCDWTLVAVKAFVEIADAIEAHSTKMRREREKANAPHPA